MLKIKDKDGKLRYKLLDEDEEPEEVAEGLDRPSGEEQQKRFDELKKRIKKLEDKGRAKKTQETDNG